MRKLAIGYFLCIANSSAFVTLGQTLYLALATYPLSVLFRSLGWRELARTDRPAGVVALVIGVLGALTYLLIVVALTVGLSSSWPILLYAAMPWTFYSFVEAVSYVRLGRLSRVPTFYMALVSVPAVLYFDAMVMGIGGEVQLPGAPIDPSGTFLVMGGLLAFSGLMAGISFLRYRPTSWVWGARSATYAPVRTGAEPGFQLQTTGMSSRGTDAVTTRQASKVRRVRVEVVAMGTSMICSRCGKESPLTSVSCASCGTAFQKTSYGLRCPVCSAPLKIAKRISADRFVCTQCFSDLRVYLTS